METRQALRPLSRLSHATTTMTTRATAPSAVTRSLVFQSSSAAVAGRRQQSTTSRTKKRLKIPPHPDFLTPASGQNHIIYNPPSSAPSVYNTPFKFLPKTDPRREANLARFLRFSADASSSSPESPLPPPMRPEETRAHRYNVTREQVDEMRRLRAEDPLNWSVLRLAAKFDCTPLFVMMCCRASPEHKSRERERLEAIKSRWGPVRTKAREERQKRKVLLLQGAL
ncbi:putative ribosomal protein [Rosellinia necatrix]|uniref:Putative ribosomal protein n=1 Tax=Rosellinia necatrix TaxID=77044 RepID=A0A1S7UIQ1_ROSNE|nr:putative ribosomal protein [Rosellinia necatrix]